MPTAPDRSPRRRLGVLAVLLGASTVTVASIATAKDTVRNAFVQHRCGVSRGIGVGAHHLEVRRQRCRLGTGVVGEGGELHRARAGARCCGCGWGRKQRVEEMNVDGARPRTFKIGRHLIPTIESLGIDRDKVVRAAGDVVAAAPARLGTRGDHPLRVGAGAEDRTRVRRRDGATAHRVSIEQNSPAARRLHYWVLPDGSVELASVNLHDDMTIPE